MLPFRQMLLKVRDESGAILGDEDSILALGPIQNLRIADTQPDLREISDAHHVESIHSPGVVPLHIPPEQSAEMFIKAIS